MHLFNYYVKTWVGKTWVGITWVGISWDDKTCVGKNCGEISCVNSVDDFFVDFLNLLKKSLDLFSNIAENDFLIFKSPSFRIFVFLFLFLLFLLVLFLKKLVILDNSNAS
jgi:hypothetical protein